MSLVDDNHLKMFRRYEEAIGELEKLYGEFEEQDTQAKSVKDFFERNPQAQEIRDELCGMVARGRYGRYLFPPPCSKTFLCDVSGVEFILDSSSIQKAFLVVFDYVNGYGRGAGHRIKMRLEDFLRPRHSSRSYWLHDPTAPCTLGDHPSFFASL